MFAIVEMKLLLYDIFKCANFYIFEIKIFQLIHIGVLYTVYIFEVILVCSANYDN